MPDRNAPAAARILPALLQVAGLVAANHVWTRLLAPLGPTIAAAPVFGGSGFGSVALLSVLEELVFRGVIQGALRRRFGPGVAIGVSALLFAGWHGAPPASVVALLLGLQLGAMRELHGLGLAIAAHVASNAVLAATAHSGIETAPSLAVGVGAVVVAGSALAALVQTSRNRLRTRGGT